VLALREDAARSRLWEQDVETVAMASGDTPPAEAARRLEVLLDLIGCLSTPPTGYLLDPAYRGMLDADERALAEALQQVADRLPEGAAVHSAAGEVAALLRRLGHGRSAGREDRPGDDLPDTRSEPRDDRLQSQRPG
jgi:hypothetical protein